MIRNYIKIAWRNLKTDRLFSVVNVLGLSLGLAITILLYLFITHERSYDNMYAQKENIYRVLLNTEDEGKAEVWTSAPAALAPAMESDLPEVKSVVRMLKHGFGDPAFITANETNFIEQKLFWTDQALIDIFDLPLLKGDATSALSRPNTVILSKSIAEKYFGTEDPIGKLITVDNNDKLEVSGVFQDFPSNSTLDCELIASFSSTNFYKNPSWSNASFETYCLLNEKANTENVTSALQVILDKNVKKEDQWYTLSLQPLNRIHLYSASFSESYSSRIGDIKEIRNLSLLALLILVIACINYMNLITARSQKRSKDVGVNKTLGAQTKNLMLRFYIETGVITLVSLVLGVVFALASVPIFNKITAQNLDYSGVLSAEFFIGLGGIWLITTLISGSYPAFYLSRFSPKSILAPSFKRGKRIVYLRKGLVVLQFAASVVLIVSVLVIYQQLQFMKSKNLGFNAESVLAISTAGTDSSAKSEALLSAIKSKSSVIEGALAQGYPGVDVSGRALYKDENDEEGIMIRTNFSDPSIAEVLELHLLAGKMPAPRVKGDTLVQVVLNKKAIEYLGLSPEEAIGKNVNMQLGNNAFISGVVDNFNFASLHQPIGAYAFHNSSREYKNYLLVRFRTEAVSTVVQEFESTFKEVVPNAAFDYVFLDKKVAKLYEKDQKTANITMVFCGLAILIACLGLFALAAFTTEQRTKEIGVRKVLGASIFSITQLISKDFLGLVLIALIIGFPLAFWLMNDWLTGFAYRIDMGWTIFLLAGVIAFCIALVTISFQSVKAALMNPTKALRSE